MSPTESSRTGRIEKTVNAVLLGATVAVVAWIGHTIIEADHPAATDRAATAEELPCSTPNDKGGQLIEELNNKFNLDNEASANEFAFNTLSGLDTLDKAHPNILPRIQAAKTTQEVALLLADYTSELGWQIHIGKDAEYPAIFQETVDQFPDEPIIITENELVPVKSTAVGIVDAVGRMPLGLLKKTNVDSISLFYAWSYAGSAADSGTGNSTDISMQVSYEPTTARGVLGHEMGHAIHKACGEGTVTGEDQYSRNNPGDFAYTHDNTTTTLTENNAKYFMSEYSTVDVGEDIAETYENLLEEGLLLPHQDGYEEPKEAKKRLLATQIAKQVPGSFNYFVAVGIAASK